MIRIIEIPVKDDEIEGVSYKEIMVDIDWGSKVTKNYGADADGKRGFDMRVVYVTSYEIIDPLPMTLTAEELERVERQVYKLTPGRA